MTALDSNALRVFWLVRIMGAGLFFLSANAQDLSPGFLVAVPGTPGLVS
jgi:hypothetical protein